jgi:hypothetical protein
MTHKSFSILFDNSKISASLSFTIFFLKQVPFIVPFSIAQISKQIPRFLKAAGSVDEYSKGAKIHGINEFPECTVEKGRGQNKCFLIKVLVILHYILFLEEAFRMKARHEIANREPEILERNNHE